MHGYLGRFRSGYEAGEKRMGGGLCQGKRRTAVRGMTVIESRLIFDPDQPRPGRHATDHLWLDLRRASRYSIWPDSRVPCCRDSSGFVGTFVFYWRHRIRHLPVFWVVFHQVHHSPARIEAMTAFYKHPVQILTDSALAAAIMYPLLGSSLEDALWFNFFAAAGELFYHANIRTPHWVKYFIQTPELHSIHHQLDVHHYNYADLPLWDRLFGTYRDADAFAARCGFPRNNERQLGRMLLFRDVYKD